MPQDHPVQQKANSIRSSTENSMWIDASQETLYRAFTDPEALAIFLAPGEMTGKVHRFELKVGKGYQMSLFYPRTFNESRGKTSGNEDRFEARFIELSPPEKIVEAVVFDTDDPAFSGEMIMEVRFEPEGSGTNVTILFSNIPPGIRPEDNEAGTIQTLEKLARYAE